ncbi:MAG: hypothetical protein ACOC44_01225 [Promethearchaeia archaeon]
MVGIPLLQAEVIKSLFSKKGEKISLRQAIEHYIRYLLGKQKDIREFTDRDPVETLVTDLMEYYKSEAPVTFKYIKTLDEC